MQYLQQNLTLTVDPATGSCGTAGIINLDGAESISVFVNNPSTIIATSSSFTSSDIDLSTSYITIPGHTFFTGLVGTMTTSSILPTPLTTTENYSILYIDSNTVQLCDNGASATFSGTSTPITLSDNGSIGGVDGTFSFNVNEYTAVACTMLISNDGTNWYDYSPPTNNDIYNGAELIIGQGYSLLADINQPTFRYVKLMATPTRTGYYSCEFQVVTKTNIAP